ncbi:hypothetical protein M8C21_004836 [Ambrosia artemisiifolia]|uniref:RING-type domain-containing protein n=1 Tax=Ambrosia artemisiifolia TaxID=4212 RepID=A0AAD5CKW3_AMBAR|nr:hypothetical protein M8C21_004836 [Ambrosia artemisiifolia]
MGGKSSKRASGRYSSCGPTSNSWAYHHQSSHPQSSYPQPPVSQPYASPSPFQSHPNQAPALKKRLERKFSRIDDNYSNLEQVTDALARAGLESSNLIVGVDFTKSNEWTGARSFNRRCLHHIGNDMNPYEEAISIIGRTLASFDEDNLIPCFGFGDASTHDQEVFSFYPDDKFCDGFEDVLKRYRELVPQLRLAGPTSFAPVIEMAITIVEQSGGQYHVLLIIADGQVTRSVDTDHGQLSPQERKTVEAIVKASEYPLSIVLVGVGDGPWDMMKEFDDNIPARAFDNFQASLIIMFVALPTLAQFESYSPWSPFVNFTDIMSKNTNSSRKETEFALAALMEIPSQYKATLELNLLGATRGNAINRVSLPPPCYGSASFGGSKQHSRSTSFQPTATSFVKRETPSDTSFYGISTSDKNLCPICITNQKDMAFGCGHQTCCGCGTDLHLCPVCRSQIQTRIKLY